MAGGSYAIINIVTIVSALASYVPLANLSLKVGRYSGYYYTVSMAAQVITPILSGVVIDVNPAMLFAYITGVGVLMGLSVAGAKHGDAILIDEVVRREEAAEAE